MAHAGTITDRRTDLRRRLHAMWATVAPGWAEHAAYADERGAHVTERMLQLTAAAPGDRVLELASGPGGLGLAAAARVAPGGEVVLSDVVAEMTAVAAVRAQALGLSNVSTRVLDIEAIDEPAEAYDIVLCREGLMFATDPARAAAEVRRVLRPGGRAAIAVWGLREQNPWLGLVFDAVSAQRGEPVPPPGIPGPFALGGAGVLAGLLEGAGLADVGVTELPVPLRAGSFEEWWTRTTALAGPLAAILDSLPAPVKATLADRLRESTRAYETPSGIELPGLALIGSARRRFTMA